MTTDTITTLIPATAHVQAARAQRAKAITATQICEDLLLTPALPDTGRALSRSNVAPGPVMNAAFAC